MYNNFESPTIQIDLGVSDNAIYLKNIQGIMETPYADRVYFYGDCSGMELIMEIAQKHPEKEYYVSYENIIGDAKNINGYHFIPMCDVTKTKKLLADIVILNIDISDSINSFDIDHLNSLMAENPKTPILQLTSTKTIRNIDFRSFVSKIELFNFDFYFDGLVKPISVIREHPCNAYLCNGQKCHSNKSNFPRYLHVTNKGIFPYCARINDIVLLKNISFDLINFKNYLEEKYNNSSEHMLFIDINRHLFQEYVINQMFAYLPWNIFMEKIYHEKY